MFLAILMTFLHIRATDADWIYLQESADASGVSEQALLTLVKASQSSTTAGGLASRAIDGNKNTGWGGKSCTHTRGSTNPQLTVDLKEASLVDEVRIWNRKDCCSERLNNAKVFVLNEGAEQFCGSLGTMKNVEQKVVQCDGKKGSKVRVKIDGSGKFLTICELEVIGRKASMAPKAPSDCRTLTVGNTRSNPKKLSFEARYKCPMRVDKSNWLGGNTYGDWFTVQQDLNFVTVTRSDKNAGWGMNLEFKCCAQGSSSTQAGGKAVPISRMPSGATARQIRGETATGKYASLAIDGNPRTCAKTNNIILPWLEIDLKKLYTITGVSLKRPSTGPPVKIYVSGGPEGKQLCKKQCNIVGSKIHVEKYPDEPDEEDCEYGDCEDWIGEQKTVLEVCELSLTGTNKIDGGVNQWGAWSSCDKSCGPGVQTRTRSCNHPTAAYGGLQCRVSLKETKSGCQVVSCVGQWAQWKEWSAASSAVNTLRYRNRVCVHEPCATDGITKQNNDDFINRCSIGAHKIIQDYDEAFITKLLEQLNKPNLKWNALLKFFKDGIESFEKEVGENCLVHGTAKYTAKFYCSLGKGTAQEKICMSYLWYERVVMPLENDDELRSEDAKKRRSSGPLVKTTIDYKTLLTNQIRKDQFAKQTENMDTIKEKMANIDKNFRQDFGGYLSQIAAFDYEIANQDKMYIATVIAMWKGEIDEWIGKISHMLNVAVKVAIAKTSFDLVDQVISLADEIAGNCNPFAWLSGAADIGDVLDAATDVAAAVKDVAAMAHLMKSLLNLADIVTEIKKGMSKNKALHEYFLTLTAVDVDVISSDAIIEVAQSFTNAYGNFFPGIKLSDIAKLIATFNGIMDGVCDEINEADSAIGTGIATGMTIAGYCTGTTIGPMIAQLESALQESYDAQYELMDAGAAMARGLISGSLSRTIQRDFEDNNVTPPPSEYVKGLLYMYMHRRNTLVSACDAIEYEHFGEENSDCTILRNDPLNKDSLKSLSELSLRERQTGCDWNDRYVTIPASTQGSKSEGTVNLLDLYTQGSTMLSFHSSKYAKEHGWIPQNAGGSQVFVSKFMLVLPPRSSDGSERNDEISITHAGANMVNGKPYFLKTSQFDSTYKYNPLMVCRAMNPLPYQVPNCPSPYSLPPCATSEGASRDQYLPTLYGDWKITLYNNKPGTNLRPLHLPNVTDTLYLQARVKTCTPNSQKKDQAQLNRDYTKIISGEVLRAPRMRRSATGCCASKGEMWHSQSKVYGQCKACPATTVPAAQGYYCKHTRCYNKVDCCTPQKQCETGEGKCKSDNDCMGELKCGVNKCSWKGGDKCCYKKSTSTVSTGSGGSVVGSKTEKLRALLVSALSILAEDQ